MLRVLVTIMSLLLAAGSADAQLLRRLFGGRSTTPSYARSGKCGNPNCPMCYPENFTAGRFMPAAVQRPAADYGSRRAEPAAGSQKQTVEQAPTPDEAIDAFLDLIPLRPSDVLYDPGCGDGRVLLAAVRRYGCLGVGIEIDPSAVVISCLHPLPIAGQRRLQLGDWHFYVREPTDAR